MKKQYKRFYTGEHVDNWYSQYKNAFPADNDNDTQFMEALNLYTASANVPINRILRSDKDILEYEFFNTIYQNLSAKFPCYLIPDNVIVYRYISKSILKSMCTDYPPKKGSILTDKGFMSTTLVQNSIRSFVHSRPELKVLLEISIPSGTNAIYVGHMKNTLQEYEIILAPNTKLHVDHTLPLFINYFKCTVVNCKH